MPDFSQTFFDNCVIISTSYVIFDIGGSAVQAGRRFSRLLPAAAGYSLKERTPGKALSVGKRMGGMER
jgi:hypothetical protein